MAFYEIDCERCSKEAEHLLKLEKEMLQYIRQIEGIEKELGKLSGFGTVLSTLAKTREKLYNEKDSMKQMGEVLHASIQCYKNTEKKLSRLKLESSAEKLKDGDTNSSAGEGIHFALDCLGLLPGIGAVFDGINACWYICEGRWGEALLSGLALIPAAGIIAGAGKIGGKAGMKAISHADDIAGLAKGLNKLDDVSDAAKDLDKLGDALDVAKYGDNVIKGGSKTNEVGNPVNIAGKGSTGRTIPNNIKEQMAMHQVQSNPLDGATELPFKLKDTRWSASDGWVKMQSIVTTSDGTKNTIHFVYNKITGAFDDFKFKPANKKSIGK